MSQVAGPWLRFSVLSWRNGDRPWQSIFSARDILFFSVRDPGDLFFSIRDPHPSLCLDERLRR